MQSPGIALAVIVAALGLAAGSSAQQTVYSGLSLDGRAAARATLLAARAAAAPLAFQEVVTQPASDALQLTNTGERLPVISTGHVLAAGTADGTAPRILYAPSEADDPAYRAAISAAAGGAIVDYFDARVATPSVATLLQYDAVHTWANFAYADNVSFGNNLAAYNDAGGAVVLGSFCTFTSGNFLAGTIMTADYCPVDSPAGTNHFTSSAYIGNGTGCIYIQVTSLVCQFRDVLVTQGSGVANGNYADGEICHAYRSSYAASQGDVIYSNGSGAIQLAGTGQWATAVANSSFCACTCGDAWSDEGSALPGVSGPPLLTGFGYMVDGGPNVLHLSHAAPKANALAFAAPASLPTPFKGGTLLPDPSWSLTFGRTSGSGENTWQFTLQPGLPAGAEIWVQWAIEDAAAVKGFALSNAVVGVKH